MNAWEKSLATRVHWLRCHQHFEAADHVELAAKEMTAEFERRRNEEATILTLTAAALGGLLASDLTGDAETFAGKAVAVALATRAALLEAQKESDHA